MSTASGSMKAKKCTQSTCSGAKTQWGTLKCSNKKRPEPVWVSTSFQLSIQQKYVAGSSGWWGHLGVQACLQTALRVHELDSSHPPCSQIFFKKVEVPQTIVGSKNTAFNAPVNKSPYHRRLGQSPSISTSPPSMSPHRSNTRCPTERYGQFDHAKPPLDPWAEHWVTGHWLLVAADLKHYCSNVQY